MKKYLLVGALFCFVLVPGASAETKVAFNELKSQTKEEFRVKLQEIKDERKKTLVVKLNDQMCMVQKRRVSLLTTQLDTMTRVLGKLTVKLNGASNEQVVMATRSVSEAKTAVTNFGTRTCGVSLSGDETKIKAEVQAARLALEADAKVVQDKVKAARKATAQAVVSVAKTLGEEVPSALKE